MKTIKVLSLIATLSLFSSALNALSVETNGFENAISFNSSPALSGNSISTNDIFAQGTVQGVAGTDIYKYGHWASANANYWGAESRTASTFNLDVAAASTGAKWRILKSTANNQYFFGNWSNLNTGENSVTIAGGVGFDRQVGFQIQGTVDINSFEHTAGGASVGSLSVVPEPSTYALLAGLVAFLYVAIRRRSA